MAQTPTPEAEANTSASAENDDGLRKRLLSRIAVAGVIIVGLLGGLAVFDSLNKPQAPTMPKMAAAPAEPPAKAEEEKPAETRPAVEEKAEKPQEPPVAAVPEKSETPIAPLPVDKAPKTAKPVTPPATARPAAVKPTPPVAAPAAKPEPRHEIARVMPESTVPKHAPPSRPLTQAGETARRFLVQVGVFSNHANAEDLLGRLQQAGIPAQIESRVQVGPFASRAEADAARTKLKSMGIDDGMLVRR